jgi:ADP-heptose:LPS heptosyltransferase
LKVRSLERPLKGALASLLKALFRSRVPEDLGSYSPKRILLIRQHNQLGDMLCVTPLLRALRGRYPEARISLMASPVNYEVMLHSRLVDHVLLYDKRELLENGRIHLKSLLRLIRSLRGSCDMVLVPGTVSTSFTSDFLAFLTHAQVRIGVESLDGKASRSSFCFNVPITLDWRESPGRHQTLRNIDLMASFGVQCEDLSLEIDLTEEELQEGRKRSEELKKGKPLLLGVHPGAGKPPNRWGAANFARLIDELRSEAAAFITSGPMDQEVLKETRIHLKQDIQVLENQAIRRVASIIKNADLYVTNDTGLMHVAASVGTPVLSLFGPTDPREWAPVGERNRYIRGEGGMTGNIPFESVIGAAREMLKR